MAEETETIEEEATSPLSAGTRPRPQLSAEANVARIDLMVSGGSMPEPESYTVVVRWRTSPSDPAPHAKGTTLSADEITVPEGVVQGTLERENKRRTKQGQPEMTEEDARKQHIASLVQLGYLKPNYAAAPEPEEAEDDEDEE